VSAARSSLLARYRFAITFWLSSRRTRNFRALLRHNLHERIYAVTFERERRFFCVVRHSCSSTR